MSTSMKKLVFTFIGLLAGLAAWPVSETVLYFQTQFSSYLIFSICMGVAFGSVMGGVLGSSEGITLSIKPKILPGIITGIVVGAFGGAIGFIIGQGSLFITNEWIFHSNKLFQSYGIPISRAIGWAFLGMFIGTIEGVRSLSPAKIRVGIFGGFIGGIVGGCTLELIKFNYPDLIFARLIGLIIMGGLIGLFYGLFEKRFSVGVLKLLNGKLKGKEYLLIQKKIKIGSSKKSDIFLFEYKNVVEEHAYLTLKKDDVFINAVDKKHRVLVNEIKITEHKLKLDDIVQVGSSKFLFFYK